MVKRLAYLIPVLPAGIYAAMYLTQIGSQTIVLAILLALFAGLLMVTRTVSRRQDKIYFSQLFARDIRRTDMQDRPTGRATKPVDVGDDAADDFLRVMGATGND